jgi:fructose-bisphosphate aldolase class II
MPMIDMRDMLNHAYRNHYAVASFGVASLEFVAAVVAAAERCRSPAILSITESRTGDHEFELIAAAAEHAARRASVPVALQLDRGGSPEAAAHAINRGCNGVMVSAAHESFPASVATTRKVADIAHACGVMVEGEPGTGAGADATPAAATYTSVEEARAFVQRTQVDCLAVSIGAAPGRPRGRAKLDIERLRRLNGAIGIPLAVHADCGLGDEQFHKLIQHGVAKVNCFAALAEAADGQMRGGTRRDYVALVHEVRAAIGAEAERCMRRWGSAGRAAEVLMQCQAWRPVEHLIVYNVEHATDAQVEAMMTHGREVLGTIPGVRRVVTGWAVADKPRYRFCWLIEFAHRAVIDSYREHPLHAQFADSLFRPIAGDRVSVDFEHVDGSATVLPGRLRERATG